MSKTCLYNFSYKKLLDCLLHIYFVLVCRKKNLIASMLDGLSSFAQYSKFVCKYQPYLTVSNTDTYQLLRYTCVPRVKNEFYEVILHHDVTANFKVTGTIS